MNDNEKRRERIFNTYTKNLNLLRQRGIVKMATPIERIYICPICTQPFISLVQIGNFLTLEDAPPKALGGKANILTCKKCNNTLGTKVDSHLVQRLRELDQYDLKPGTEMRVKVPIGNDVFNGILAVDDNGVMTVTHSEKNNHPTKLAAAIQNVKGGMVLNADFLKSKVIPENLEYALLKTGYLLAFERFGYSLMLHKCFNVIRQQLLEPEKSIYPSKFWLTPPVPKSQCGVHIVEDKGFESILSIFEVKTKHTERIFGVILPLPIEPVNEVIDRIHERLENAESFQLTLYPTEGNNYLSDMDNLDQLYLWIQKRQVNPETIG